MRDALCVLMQSVHLPAEAFSSGTDFLTRCKSDLRGCLLLDVRMPGLSGIELFRSLRAASINIPTILISAHGNIRQAVQAMREGAFDFIEKPFDDQDLLDRVYSALREDAELRRKSGRIGDVRDRLKTLTRRERTVFQSIAEGMFNKEIANTLGISIRTVENHRSRVMTKLGAKGVADLVRIAVLLGLVDH